MRLGVTTRKTLLTAEDLEQLPDDGRYYELLDGELVEVTPPGPRHGRAVTRTSSVLDSYASERKLGYVVSGNPGIILRRQPDRVRGPDVCFFPAEKFPGAELPASYTDVVPDFVAEVVSPNDRPGYIAQKIAEWLASGVRLIWALYPETRSVVAHRPGMPPRTYGQQDTIDGEPVFPDLAVPVVSLFS